jgi:hypothetical protein
VSLAELHQEEIKALNQAVKRNAGRFPEQFMFQVTNDEFEDLRSQIVIFNKGRGTQKDKSNIVTGLQEPIPAESGNLPDFPGKGLLSSMSDPKR